MSQHRYAHIFSSPISRIGQIETDFFNWLNQVYLDGLRTLTVASNSMGSSRTLNTNGIGYSVELSAAISSDPSRDYGWVWPFLLPKRVQHASTSDASSEVALQRVQALLEGDFNRLCADVLRLMPFGRSRWKTIIPATRRHRQDRAVQLGHHELVRDYLKALISAVPPLGKASVWDEVCSLFPIVRDAVLYERLTAMLNDWSQTVPTAFLASPC